jgi:hypothetical protein
MGRHLLGMGGQPACPGGPCAVLFGMPVWRHDVRWGQGNDLRLSGTHDHRGDSGMRKEGVAMAPLTRETMVAMHGIGRTGVGAIQRHQELVVQDAKMRHQAVLFKARKALNKHWIEDARRERIEQRADLMVTGNLRHVAQSMGVIVTCGLLQPALVLQKRRRLGEKDATGAPSGILDGLSCVGPLLAMVRQLSGPAVHDALEDIEA